MSFASSLSPVAVVLAGLFALVPDDAGACSNPCGGVPYFDDVDPVNAAAIPVDGVLVLRAIGNELTDANLIDGLELVVTRDGQPITGAVETTPADGVLVWRPALPFEPSPHAVHISFPDPVPDGRGHGCEPNGGESDFEFVVQGAPSEPLVAPVVVHEPSVASQASQSLEELVCCDGAFPQVDDGGCIPQTSWSEGECAPNRATGLLGVTLTIQPSQDPATSGLLLRSFFVDGVATVIGLGDQATPWVDHPFCTHVELLNLATGETSVSEQVCHGEDVADQLGPQVLDPKVALAGKCEGPLYTCTIIEEGLPRWDPADCMPLEPEETTDGPTSSDSEGATDSADTGGDADPTSAGPGSDTATTSDTAGGSDTASTSDSAGGGEDGLVDHGCACDGAPGDLGDHRGLLGLLGLGLLARARRRR